GRGSYVLPGREHLDGLLGHLLLSAVREQARRLRERQPARFRDLVPELLGDVAEPAALVADEEERDHLEDPLAVPVEPVAGIAELAQRVPVGARLLGDLAQGGLLARLAWVDLPLRQHPEPLGLPGGPNRRQNPLAVELPDEDSTRGEVPAHV